MLKPYLCEFTHETATNGVDWKNTSMKEQIRFIQLDDEYTNDNRLNVIRLFNKIGIDYSRDASESLKKEYDKLIDDLLDGNTCSLPCEDEASDHFYLAVEKTSRYQLVDKEETNKIISEYINVLEKEIENIKKYLDF